MTDNKVRLTNGQSWTAEEFVDHYFRPTASGTPTPVAGPPTPVDVDRSWYMGEGPGRYYDPGMFPIVRRVINRRDIVPGTYDLWQFAPEKGEDPAVKASISHYFKDPRSEDFKTRALVFGNESARISGKLTVNQDGSKTFHGIEIRPLDTNFDFEPNTWNPFIEGPRQLARRKYDPENLGAKYDIQYRGPGPNRGTGRIYDSFTDAQLNAALRDPGRAPPGLLSSITGKPPLPYAGEHLQYLDRTNPTNPQALPSAAGVPAAPFVSPASDNTPGNGIANWIAAMAGVDPTNPMRPAPQQSDKLRGIVSDEPMPDLPFPPPIFNRR